MDLHVTVVGAPGSSRPPAEIVVDTETIRTGATLAERLEGAGWSAPLTVDGVLLAALPNSHSLPDGAVIVAGAPVELRRRPTVSHLAFVVHEGPDAGQVLPLSRGVYVIGRAAADIIIADPALSRRHARLTVTEDSIVLEDLASVNGTHVDGRAVSRMPITVSSTVRMGASHCRLDLLSDPPWPGPTTPCLPEPVPVSPELPRQPSRVLVLTALLPLVLGIVLALTTGMWFFLAFSGLSAVTGLVPLLTYRRAARAFTEAVRQAAAEDRRRRILAAPDPGLTGLDARRALHVGPATGTTADAAPPEVVLLRLGTAVQPANLAVRRTEGTFEPPDLAGVPLLIPCSANASAAPAQSLTITGDDRAVEGLIRSLLLQVSHPSGGLPTVVCWGSAREIPEHARFLPNVHVSRDPRILTRVLARPGLSLIFHFSGHLPPGATRPGTMVQRATGSSSGSDPFVIRVRPGGEGSALAVASGASSITLTDGRGRALIDGSAFDVMPDAVSARTFERTARVLARAMTRSPARSGRGRGATADAYPMGLPPSASLWSAHFGPANLASEALTTWSSSDPSRPTAHLGSARHGTVVLDLVKDGPHLLVAGTTGSGKSEFLRTLVLGLAIGQPPEDLTLLLIDYKGGSGLGDLAALPHCVGSMSDLSSESTARAFVSLRAELRRRETSCADHGARDLDHLRQLAPKACPPRLVVVIDEFRMLVDDVPAAMPDLLKIASLGRSLGVHLILATQKAQGAVPPDMRANITSTVLLRVRTALESQDLLGSAVAAEIPVDLPGRAYLRRGNEPPVEFQVAACSTPPPSEVSRGWQDLDAHIDGTTPTSPRERSGTLPILLREAVSALVEAAGTSETGHPRRPVLPPLPDQLLPIRHASLPPASPAHGSPSEVSVGHTAAVVNIGLMDLPHHQTQLALHWRPQEHSHLALVGLPGSGGTEALSAIVAVLPSADPDVHLYLLDGDGSLGLLHTSGATDPIGDHLGALVQPHETRRAARVLERLAGLPPDGGDERRIVLAITGWSRWMTQFRGVRGGHAEEDLQAIVRDGVLSGVTVLILGDRDLTASRFFPLIPNRVYLPFGSPQEITLTWPKMPPIDPLPGRALVQGRITGPWGDSVCQILQRPFGNERIRPPGSSPFPVHPLPTILPLTDVQGPGNQQGDPVDHVTLGVHGDDLEPYRVTLNPGETFLVLGHPGSGRTNALRLFDASDLVRSGRRSVLAPAWGAHTAEKEHFWRTTGMQHTAPDDPRGRILLVDDAEGLPADVHRIIGGLVAAGAAAVLTARPSGSLMARVPLALQARAAGQGLILAPRTASDGDLFGVRPDVEGTCPAGRGYVVEPWGTFEVQTALVPSDPHPLLRGAATSTAFVRSRWAAR